MIGYVDITDGVQLIEPNLECLGLQVASDIEYFMGDRVFNQKCQSISRDWSSCGRVIIDAIS